MTVTTFEGIENAGSPPADGAEDCEHEICWTSCGRVVCDACEAEISRTRQDPRYIAHPMGEIRPIRRILRPPPGTPGCAAHPRSEIPPTVSLVAWAGEIEMGGWTGDSQPYDVDDFAECVADELHFNGSPESVTRIVIRLVEEGRPGPVVYRDGGVRWPERG